MNEANQRPVYNSPTVTQYEGYPNRHPASFFRRLLYSFPLLIIFIASVTNYWLFPSGSFTHFDMIIFYVINIASGVYSFLALFLRMSLKENYLANSVVFKKLFEERELHWHEIHSTITTALITAHISTLIFIDQPLEFPYILTVCTIACIICLWIEWYNAAKFDHFFCSEANILQGNNLKKSVLTLFKRSSLILHLLKLVCLIAIGIICYIMTWYFGAYFCLLIAFLILISIVQILIQLIKNFEITKLSHIVPKHKYETYFAIAATTLAFLIILLESIYMTTNCQILISDEMECDYTHFIFSHPIIYILSVISFIISFLDLYTQAVFNSSRVKTYAPVSTQERDVEMVTTVLKDSSK